MRGPHEEARSREERLSLGLLEKLPRKMLRGQMGLPENWSHPSFPPQVTDKRRHLLHSVGNFPIPHQEKNKAKKQQMLVEMTPGLC